MIVYGLLALAAIVLGAQLVALLTYLLHPLLALVKSAASPLFVPFLGWIDQFDAGLGRAERTLRGVTADAARQFVHGEDDDEQPWFWAGVIRPALAFTALGFLLIVDVYFAALTFEALFGTTNDSGVAGNWTLPSLQLNIPLLSGAMYGVLALVFGEATWDAASRHPRRPYSALEPQARRVVASILAIFLLLVIASGPMFFLWRLGALGAHENPYGFLAPAIVATLGVLLPAATVVTARQGLPFVAAVVVAGFAAADMVLWALRVATRTTHFAGHVVFRLIGLISDALIKLGERTRQFDAAVVRQAAPIVQTVASGSTAAGAGAVGVAQGVTLGVAGALANSTVGFWKLLELIVRGIGRGVTAVAIAIRDAICYCTPRFAAAIGTTAAWVARAVKAVAIWVWNLLPRFRKMLGGWICRFQLAQRLHFGPPNPPGAGGTHNAGRQASIPGDVGAGVAILPVAPASPSPAASAAPASETTSSTAASST